MDDDELDKIREKLESVEFNNEDEDQEIMEDEDNYDIKINSNSKKQDEKTEELDI